jgi:hypothetical protein
MEPGSVERQYMRYVPRPATPSRFAVAFLDGR